jgi:gliding motility-associated-like protein
MSGERYPEGTLTREAPYLVVTFKKNRLSVFRKLAWTVLLLFCGQMVFAQQYLEFVENKGQWDRKIRFAANTMAGAVALQADGYRVLLNKESDMLKVNPHPHNQHIAAGLAKQTQSITPGNTDNTEGNGDGGGGPVNDGIIRSHVYQVKFLNANPDPVIIPDKVLPTYNNYIIGNDSTKWTSNCKVYQAVTYKNVYPNIDIRYYTANGVLKYDVIVNPGGNLSDLAMYIDGADGVKLKEGALQITTSVGEVREMAPYTYQSIRNTRVEIPCQFEVKGNIVRFKLNGAYNKDAVMVVDPSVVFYGYTGSTADNWGFTATYDAQGNFYAGGIVFQGGQFPVSNGAFQRTFQGGVPEGALPAGTDIAIIKYDPSGANRIYATYLGGTGNEQPHSLVVDNAGNLIIAGRTSSGASYPVRGLGKHGVLGGTFDIILTKLNATGTDIISSLRIGGGGDDGVNVRPNYTGTQAAVTTRRNYGDDARSEVILDAAGDVILAGVTQSSDFPVTANAFQKTPGGASTTTGRLQDAVVIKMSPDLNTVLFSSYLGGAEDDAAFVLAINPTNGNIYVAGATTSSDFPGNKAGVLFPTFQGTVDGFVTIISPDGSQQLSTSYFATSGVDVIYGIQFDRSGFPYIMGTTTVAWPVINSPYNANGNQTNAKQFIAKLQPDLSAFVYSTNFGTNNANIPNISPTAFLVDRCENVYVSGWGGDLNTAFQSAGTRGLITAGSGVLRTDTDGQDLYFFVLERNAQSVLYATFFGTLTTQTNPALGDHVDGGTSRFDQNGTIYQAICSCKGQGSTIRGTAGVWSPDNQAGLGGGGTCNLLAIKLAFNLAGVGAGLQASINGTVRDTSGCVPLTVDFRDTLAQGKAYYWNFGDGSPEVRTTNPTISHTFNNVGLYRVRLVAVDSSTCNATDTAYVNMRVRNDEAVLAFTSTKIPPCESLAFQFNNTSIAPAGKPFKNNSFRWDFGDNSGQVAGPGTVTHTYAAGGTYNVKLILTDSNYCNYPDSLVQQIRIAPNVKAQFTTPATGCAPYTAAFTNTSLAGQQFIWDFGDGGTSTATNPTHLYNTPGTYVVTLVAIDNATCNISDTIRQTILVSGKPTAAYTYSPNPTEPNTAITFTNNSSGGVLYKWLFGDGDSLITAQRDTVLRHLYNKTGTYNACLVTFNASGCSDTTCQTIQVTINSGFELPNAFSPNGDGRNDKLYVRGFGIARMTWRIYNRWGVLVYASNNPDEGWDGTYKGVLQPQDVYHYTVQIEYSSGEKVSKKGDITLLR